MESTVQVALTYTNGDYITVPINIPEDGGYPEFITYAGHTFKIAKITENGRYIYSQVNEKLDKEFTDMDYDFPDDECDLEGQIENLMGIVDDQSTIIADLRNRLMEQNDIISAFRDHIHKNESKKIGS